MFQTETCQVLKTWQVSVTLLIFSTIFQHVISLPPLGHKIQLTEFLFVPVLLLFPYRQLLTLRWDKRNRNIFICLCAYLLVNLVASLLSGNVDSILESVGKIYLAVFCFVLVVFFLMLKADQFRYHITAIFFHMGWVLSLIALSGYLLLYFGWENNLIIRLDEYPYLGTVYRLRGPTYTPTMFCTILAPCILVPLCNWNLLPYRKPVRFILMAVILLAALLSFSKSILIIAWALLLILMRRFGILNRITVILTAIPLVVFLFIATHFVFAKPGTPVYERYMNTTFISDRVSFSVGGWQALETSYYLNKKIALELFAKHPAFGIGTGNFNEYVDQYKSRGHYPQRFFSYDPHSTWLGVLAENGALGFLAIIIFLFLVFRPFFRFQIMKQDDICFAVFLLCCFFLIEGIATDIFNFRHFWVFIAVALAAGRFAGFYGDRSGIGSALSSDSDKKPDNLIT